MSSPCSPPTSRLSSARWPAGYFNFTTKSGTNSFHGSAYEYWANEALDAAHPFSHVSPRDRKNDYGFTVGGPVWIPKLYNGKNKTFFFFNLERFGNNQLSTATYGTVPTAAYRKGDFSAALTGNTLTDPTTGYQFPENAIYDPLSTYTDANGNVVRTQFPGNIIPPSRMDPVALKVQTLIPAPINAQTTLNWLPSISTNTHTANSQLQVRREPERFHQAKLLLEAAAHQPDRRSRRLAVPHHRRAPQAGLRQSVPP